MHIYEELRYSVEHQDDPDARSSRQNPKQFTVLSNMNYFGDETYFSANPLLHVVGMMMLMGQTAASRDKLQLVKSAGGVIMWDAFLHSMIENASYWIFHVLDESVMPDYRRMSAQTRRREMLFRYAKYILRFFDAFLMHTEYQPCDSTTAQEALVKLVARLRYIKKEIYNRSNTVIQLRLGIEDCEKYKQQLYTEVFNGIARVAGDSKPTNTIEWLVVRVCNFLNVRCAMVQVTNSYIPRAIAIMTDVSREIANYQQRKYFTTARSVKK